MPFDDDLVITSPRNPRVRAAADLRDRRTRDETGRTLVDGARELDRALIGGAAIETVFVDDGGLTPAGAETIARARAAGAEIIPVSPVVLARLAYGDRTEGLVAVVAIPDRSLAALDVPADALVVVLEAVEKPGNLGAVLRSADAAGADAVIVADPRTDLFNPNAIRASLGTIFALPVAAGTSAEVEAWLAEREIAVLAARVGSSLGYTDADLRGPVALVLGSEADGLSDAWTGERVTAISLPMHGVADSLNVSITAAVLLYEARRQRA